MNFIQIYGNLGADPEVRMTPNGNRVTSLRVATNMRRGKEPDKKEKTIWWRVDVWGTQFDKLISYLKKGSSVIVGGELDPEIYIDKEGKSQLSLRIRAETVHFNPFKSDKPEQDQKQQQQQPFAGSAAAPAGRPNARASDLDVEFEESKFAFASNADSKDSEDTMPF